MAEPCLLHSSGFLPSDCNSLKSVFAFFDVGEAAGNSLRRRERFWVWVRRKPSDTCWGAALEGVGAASPGGGGRAGAEGGGGGGVGGRGAASSGSSGSSQRRPRNLPQSRRTLEGNMTWPLPERPERGAEPRSGLGRPRDGRARGPARRPPPCPRLSPPFPGAPLSSFTGIGFKWRHLFIFKPMTSSALEVSWPATPSLSPNPPPHPPAFPPLSMYQCSGGFNQFLNDYYHLSLPSAPAFTTRPPTFTSLSSSSPSTFFLKADWGGGWKRKSEEKLRASPLFLSLPPPPTPQRRRR